MSKDGFVYGFVPGGVDFAKHVESQEESFHLQSPKRIGIKEASTFTGFCNQHDTVTFLPIERNPFRDELEHCFLLAYRAICRSLFMKKGNADFVELWKQLDKGRTVEEQLQMHASYKANKAWFADMLSMVRGHKKEYDQALIDKDYSKVLYYVIRIDTTPEIMCNGTITPHFDFQGKILQEPNKPYVTQEHITFSIIPTDNGGAIVFSWIGGDQVAKKLVPSLIRLPESQLPHAIVRFTFEHFENVFASPIWWDNLARNEQNAILKRSQVIGQKQDDLKDDGLRVVSWAIKSQKTNITFD